VTTPDQTPDELRIAERYLWVLDFVSRCADAVRQGDWEELNDVAQSLARRAEQLAGAARELQDKTADPRAHVVVGIVAKHNGDSEAAGLLHPNPPGAISKTSASGSLLEPFPYAGAADGAAVHSGRHRPAGRPPVRRRAWLSCPLSPARPATPAGSMT
jgi:hypothetical protein